MSSTAQGTSSATTSPESTATSNATPPILKSYSCVLCAQRKVKCDKAPGGCSNCTKARVSCVYKAPPPPRRRKKGTREIDIHAKLKLYEETLRKLGVEPCDLEIEESARHSGLKIKGGDSPEKSLNGQAENGRQDKNRKDAGILVADQGKSRYLENSLWTNLQKEFRHSQGILDDDSSSDEDVLEAKRIAQRLGLHRDGQDLGLSPFDTEIRRRLWWQTLMLDGFAEKLAGTGGDVFYGDTRIPSNLNDSDLTPGMKELPKEHEGATEMMFFLIRCNLGASMKKTSNLTGNFDGIWNKLSARGLSLSAKDKAIDELEATFQRKFLQYCDHAVPWHFMCTYLARAIIFMMRFMAHNPDHHGPHPERDMPQAERDMLFDMSLQVTAAQNLAYTSKSMQGYLWHVTLHFPWKALIYLLACLRYRTHGADVDKAWEQIELVYEFHPNFATELSRKALPIAIGKLTLRAWEAFIAARGTPEKGEPYFIQMLRTRNFDYERKKSDALPSEPTPSSEPSASPNTDLSPSPAQPPMNPIREAIAAAQPSANFVAQSSPLDTFQWDSNFAESLDAPPAVNLPALDPDQMNWTSWDNLLADYQMVDIHGSWATNESLTNNGNTGHATTFGFAGSANSPPRYYILIDISLLQSGSYSDLIITCNGDTYKVHKAVVCPRCDFFARAVNFDGKAFSAFGILYAQDGKIDLPEDDATAVKLLIQYLYEGEYEPYHTEVRPAMNPSDRTTFSVVTRSVSGGQAYTYDFPHTCRQAFHCYQPYLCPHHTCGHQCSNNCQSFLCSHCCTPTITTSVGTAEELPLHSKMYEIADKYDVVGLKDLVMEKFRDAATQFWNHRAFATAAHHAFTTTMEEDKGLRDIVCKTISDHMTLLEKPTIEALMMEFNGLAFGLLKAKSQANGWK
ncbi:hypothetical protein K491DRAFT_704486 [Lophiostoma macrostomum CBS 122681]|uniref:Zn(2)-C6 fungal-type domain-containing protein n=1 Tax=Lophiostoma macrostomum CBS 122681 TaxID=1314788 RepID=A0A6A6T6H7_9PLEO|nr:hypothetical protein K491DRAFT_704486 [Lophiostoma macrostomum CBS 122681]